MTTAVIWSKADCPHCDQAKRLMTQHGMTYEERSISSGWSREQLLEAVPTARSVPQIFINGLYVGGFQQLQRYFSEGLHED